MLKIVNAKTKKVKTIELNNLKVGQLFKFKTEITEWSRFTNDSLYMVLEKNAGILADTYEGEEAMVVLDVENAEVHEAAGIHLEYEVTLFTGTLNICEAQ